MRFTKELQAHRAQGRLVLHYPASGPSPVALIALTGRSLIVDRTLAGGVAGHQLTILTVPENLGG